MKRLLTNFNVLNLFLLFSCLLLMHHIYFDLYKGSEISETQIEEMVSVKEEDTDEDVEEEEDDNTKKETASLDYGIIADKNIFHPERRIPPEKKQQVELPKPEFVLYGTVITDNLKIAYVEDLKAVKTTVGRGKRQTALKVGQSLSGYLLKDITQNSAIFTRGDETIEVKVVIQKGKRSDLGQIQGGFPPQIQPQPGQQTIQPGQQKIQPGQQRK